MTDFPQWGKEIGKGRKVHRVAHERGVDYCISGRGGWLPGCYDSEETARQAFDVDEAGLQRLQDSVNPGGVITGAMLDSAVADASGGVGSNGPVFMVSVPADRVGVCRRRS